MSTYRMIQGAILVVLVVAFVTSFQSGSDGAGRLGYPPVFVVALPLVCDVVAGVATAIHGRVRKDKQMRRLVSWFVLVPMALSWGANSVDHAYRAADAATGWPQAARIGWFVGVVLAAGICPVAVAALLHLSTRFLEFEQRASGKTSRAEAAAKSTARITAEPAKPVTTPKPAPRVAADDLAAARREKERLKKAAQRARKREAQS